MDERFPKIPRTPHLSPPQMVQKNLVPFAKVGIHGLPGLLREHMDNVSELGERFGPYWASGECYGSVCVADNSTTTPLTTQNTWYKITVFDTEGPLRGTAFTTGHELQAGRGGVYRLSYQASFKADANAEIEFALDLDGTKLSGSLALAEPGLSTQPLQVSGEVDAVIDIGNKVALYARCISADSVTLTVVHGSVRVREIP